MGQLFGNDVGYITWLYTGWCGNKPQIIVLARTGQMFKVPSMEDDRMLVLYRGPESFLEMQHVFQLDNCATLMPIQ